MQFNVSTGAAREEERHLLTSKNIIEELLQEISTNNRWSAELAKTIFELLIPNDFKEQLKKQNNINWIVDNYTAAYPWELLQDDAVNAKPLAVNAGMIRQLSTQDYRLNIKQVSEHTAFILADPDLKGFVFQLPGAKQEGDLVNEMLVENGFDTNNVIGSSGHIIKELFSKSYKIIHLAGHGVFSEDPSKGSGMLIGHDIYLSTREICQMSTVPEFVFVNCCYLGKVDGDMEALYTNRYKLAANIGTQLIRNGVKAVVVAGWAVDDAAALDFTKVFYQHLLDGYNFGESVQQARKTIYERYKSRNNTWGAYQCYGDPFYKLINDRKHAVNNEYSFVIAREAEIELTNLINRLELSGIDDATHKAQLEGISLAIDKANIRNGKITELEAIVFNGLRMYQQSVDKYASLIDEEQAVFSFAAMEQYCSVRIKNAVEICAANPKKRKQSIDTAMKVIKDLDILCGYSATSERLILLGSSYRRLALISANGEDKIKWYELAASYYHRAYDRPNSTNKIHALCSWINIEHLLVLAGNRKWGAQLKEYKLWSLQKIETELSELIVTIQRNSDASNYWDMAAIANLKLCLFLLGKGGFVIADIVSTYTSLWANAGTTGKKTAEIEMCDLLIDALSNIDSAKAKRNTEELKILRSELINFL